MGGIAGAAAATVTAAVVALYVRRSAARAAIARDARRASSLTINPLKRATGARRGTPRGVIPRAPPPPVSAPPAHAFISYTEAVRARALATRPKLLLMDEPFGALDEMTRDYLNEELLRLREEQKWTALFVTHSVAEAVFLSTRVVVLQAKPGRIRRDITIPFPFPRLPNLRSEPAFLDMVGQVSQALRDICLDAKGAKP
jgi:hypothetical protein